MTQKKLTTTDHSSKKPYASPVSLNPLTPEQAISAALRVNPKDVAKLEAAEKAKKKRAIKNK